MAKRIYDTEYTLHMDFLTLRIKDQNLSCLQRSAGTWEHEAIKHETAFIERNTSLENTNLLSTLRDNSRGSGHRKSAWRLHVRSKSVKAGARIHRHCQPCNFACVCEACVPSVCIPWYDKLCYSLVLVLETLITLSVYTCLKSILYFCEGL